jgi:molecular chaperone DnaK
MAADNKSLGRFILDGIPPAPRGIPQIEVAFDINADGILNVSAKDKATSRQQAMQIMPSSGLNDKEIEKMVKDAERHAADDAKRRESVEASNMADSAVYSAEKFLRDNADKIPDTQKSAIQSQIDAVKSASGGSMETIRGAVDRLQQALQAAGAAMYQQGAAEPGADGGPGQAPGNDEDVIEGEFSEN